MEHFSIKKYCKELLKEAATPTATNRYLSVDEKEKSIDQTKYISIIGSLLYLTASRLDIMFSVCMCERYQFSPKESIFSAVTRIMKYLRGTLDVGLWYTKGVEISLLGYSDSYFVECKLDRKSTSGTCHMLDNDLVSWNSKKQACVALPMTEAEYIVVRSYCAQILWLKQLLFGFELHLEPIPLRHDNTSAISLTKNPIMHSRTKHIEIRHHLIRDHIHKGDSDIEFLDTVSV